MTTWRKLPTDLKTNLLGLKLRRRFICAVRIDARLISSSVSNGRASVDLLEDQAKTKLFLLDWIVHLVTFLWLLPLQ